MRAPLAAPRLRSLLLVAWIAAPASADADSTRDCLRASGGQARTCFQKTLNQIERCRRKGDAACEEALRAEGGLVEALHAAVEAPIRSACSEETAAPLAYSSVDDVVLRIGEACTDFSEDALAAVYGDDPAPPADPAARSCERLVASGLRRLRHQTLTLFGPGCFVKQLGGAGCDRARRDARIADKRERVRETILSRCGAAFDALGISRLDPQASTLEERVDELVDRTIRHTRHLAQLTYPPNDLGPDADFGPYPVGVTTLALADATRQNVAGDGPRPVTTEVYYPSTPAAVAGLGGDVVTVFGIPIVETPAVRDVAIASGSHPLVVFSHGNNGIRFQSLYFAAHLASHGYVVVSPDHHGNHFVDTLGGTVDAQSTVNRPLDLSFLIDTFVAFDADPGGFFEGAIDEDAIGASGHSFGGYTTWALAGPGFAFGTFTDPRVKAILPQAPSSALFSDEFFGAIAIPTLILGGSIDDTTPFASQQQVPYDALPTGASVVALAKIVDAGHFTFSDYCEVPRTLLGFLGGFDEACEPRHLPWRHARDIANYLALNFFDATLKDDADDRAKLSPAALAWIEDLEFSRK